MTTILICDDHPVVAVGLREILSKNLDFQVLEAISTARQIGLATHYFCPDVLFLDVNVDGENMVEQIHALKKLRPTLRVVVFTSYNLPDLVAKSFARGADAYLLKNSSIAEILEAVFAVLKGEKHIGKEVRLRESEHRNINQSSRVPAHDFEIFQNLTVREKEIFDLCESGKTEADIAELLGLSKHTVHTHRKHLLKKLGLHGTADLVRYAAHLTKKIEPQRFD